MNVFHTYSNKSLSKNKVRTIVTIIGIILSVAMLTAVTTIVTSITNYGKSYVMYNSGGWHVFTESFTTEQYNDYKESSYIKDNYELQQLGYANVGTSNAYKPYLYVAAMNDDFKENMPIHLIEGRLPENSSEIIIPDHLYNNGGVEYHLNQEITLDLGYRYDVDTDSPLWQYTGFIEGETLSFNESRTYTVVGFYERSDNENYSAPGYTALTVSEDGSTSEYYSCYSTCKKVSDSYKLLEQIPKDCYSFSNTSLLRYYGLSQRHDFNSVVYGMGGILMVIIIFGSISLIYNTFAISIGERTKQFGLLSSIGATRSQMIKIICYEALVLSAIAIPFGIISGIVGIGITLHFVGEPLGNFIGAYENVELTLSVSWEAVVISAVLSVITVLISAYIPMRRALRLSSIDAIRQHKDIVLKPNSLSCPKFILKFFGVEGTIAYKNSKRSRKQYRATIISLSVSIILFITAGAFTNYLSLSYTNAVYMEPYDISVQLYDNKDIDTYVELNKQILEIEGLEHVYSNYRAYSYVSETEVLYNFDEEAIYSYFLFLTDDVYQQFLEFYNLDKEKYLDSSSLSAVVFDSYYSYNGETNNLETINYLSSNCNELLIYKYTETGYSTTETIQVGDLIQDRDFHEFTQSTLGLPSNELYIICPVDAYKNIASLDGVDSSFAYTAKDHNLAATEIKKLLYENNFLSSYVNDVAAYEEEARSTLLMINVFCFGFIILISLISIANIFNTISTNINLRKREFAMLKSFGMTERGFIRMLNYECLLYGIKGIFYGLTISVVLSMLMFYSSTHFLGGFYLPWKYVLIAVISVFLVVYTTMIYGRIKLKKENIVEALKSELQ